MKIQIKHRFTGSIIVEGDYKDIKECLEKNRGADLGGETSGAQTSGAQRVIRSHTFSSLRQ